MSAHCLSATVCWLSLCLLHCLSVHFLKSSCVILKYSNVLLCFLAALEDKLSELTLPDQGLVKPGDGLFDLLSSVNITQDTLGIFCEMLRQVSNVVGLPRTLYMCDFGHQFLSMALSEYACCCSGFAAHAAVLLMLLLLLVVVFAGCSCVV